ncbi:hypothetical protein [Streptomyces sp. MH13]
MVHATPAPGAEVTLPWREDFNQKGRLGTVPAVHGMSAAGPDA